MALISTTEAKQHLPALEGTGEDSLISTLIDRTGRVFARYCGYPPASVGGNPTMESATYTLYLDGSGCDTLRFPVWPVSSITSIYDDPTRGYSSTYLVPSTDYTVDGDEGLVVLATTGTWGAFSSAKRAVKATFVAGYATVPDDLKLAACLYVRHLWDLRHTQGRASVVEGNATGSMREETIPAAVRELLAPYRLPSVYA